MRGRAAEHASLTIAPTPLPRSPCPENGRPPVRSRRSVAPQTGMTAIAPAGEPTRKRPSTDDDLSAPPGSDPRGLATNRPRGHDPRPRKLAAMTYDQRGRRAEGRRACAIAEDRRQRAQRRSSASKRRRGERPARRDGRDPEGAGQGATRRVDRWRTSRRRSARSPRRSATSTRPARSAGRRPAARELANRARPPARSGAPGRRRPRPGRNRGGEDRLQRPPEGTRHTGRSPYQRRPSRWPPRRRGEALGPIRAQRPRSGRHVPAGQIERPREAGVDAHGRGSSEEGCRPCLAMDRPQQGACPHRLRPQEGGREHGQASEADAAPRQLAAIAGREAGHLRGDFLSDHGAEPGRKREEESAQVRRHHLHTLRFQAGQAPLQLGSEPRRDPPADAVALAGVEQVGGGRFDARRQRPSPRPAGPREPRQSTWLRPEGERGIRPPGRPHAPGRCARKPVARRAAAGFTERSRARTGPG